MKNDINTKLIVAETLENTFDNAVADMATTVLDEAVKGFPIVNAVRGIFNGYQNYQTVKRANQLLVFVNEYEQYQAGQILTIFKDQKNFEMGQEVLNALEHSYINLHAQMIARITILYDTKQLKRNRFLKYAHIIPKLSSYLLTNLQAGYHLHVERKNNENYRIFNNELDGAGEELTSYGFFRAVATMGGGDFYEGIEELEFFCEHIMNNKHGKKD